MDWVKDGQTVSALYIGKFPVRGIVLESRVKCGGTVDYIIQLDKPLQLPWDTNARRTVSVDANQIVEGV